MLHTTYPLAPNSTLGMAMLATCYLNNVTYHVSEEGVSITMATGFVPDLSHLRVLGAPPSSIFPRDSAGRWQTQPSKAF